MKIFDFSNGRKGRLLGTTGLASSLGATYHDGTSYIRITMAGCEYHTNAFSGCHEIRPHDFGVEAICFCTGEMDVGSGGTKWLWNFVATHQWMVGQGFPNGKGMRT